jgi:lipoyl-dependent peroxiredoxin subunit D
MSENHALIDQYLDGHDSAVARDLKLNMKRVFLEGALSAEEKMMVLTALARAEGVPWLEEIGMGALRALQFSDEKIREILDSAAIMGMVNTYYKFKHFIKKDEDYQLTGLRMQSLGRPLIGKEQFEMLAFAISVLNGCESCIKGHEAFLRDHGVSVDKIHDLARGAALIKAMGALRK